MIVHDHSAETPGRTRPRRSWLQGRPQQGKVDHTRHRLDYPAPALDGLLLGLEQFHRRMQHERPRWLPAQVLRRELGKYHNAVERAVPNDRRAAFDYRDLSLVGGGPRALLVRYQVDLDRNLSSAVSVCGVSDDE
jgi:hypothetical protein